MIRRLRLVIAGLGLALLVAGCANPFAHQAALDPYVPPPPAPAADVATAEEVVEEPTEDPASSDLIGPATPRRSVIERIEVEKGARRMTLWRDGKPYRTYRVALGSRPLGHKRHEGDGRTPEGDYIINRANPNSQFYLSLGISYPDPEDRAWAKARRVRPGGDIFIHGHGLFAQVSGKRRTGDWTEGCIAVTNAEMEEIYAMVGIGTPIRIKP